VAGLAIAAGFTRCTGGAVRRRPREALHGVDSVVPIATRAAGTAGTAGAPQPGTAAVTAAATGQSAETACPTVAVQQPTGPTVATAGPQPWQVTMPSELTVSVPEQASNTQKSLQLPLQLPPLPLPFPFQLPPFPPPPPL